MTVSCKSHFNNHYFIIIVYSSVGIVNTSDWISEGCTTIFHDSGLVNCSCNHLTNFAVLTVGIIICPHMVTVLIDSLLYFVEHCFTTTNCSNF